MHVTWMRPMSDFQETVVTAEGKVPFCDPWNPPEAENNFQNSRSKLTLQEKN